MTEENVLRLAISMEDRAPTTIEKYICKLVECVLFDSPQNSLTIIEICESIKSNYQLEFDVMEIQNSIKKKGKNRIDLHNLNYQLSTKARDSLSKQPDMLSILKKHISNYAKTNNLVLNEIEFLDLILRYLYFCFNSNIKNLMTLLQNHNNGVVDTFSASNSDIEAINGFITWDNDEKNRFLYSVVSFSYEYCMLTTKKDSLLTSKIFKGKKFILDTNIIFRMAGINKDEGQYVTNSFIKKCKEVGINICYTSEILSELYRVIKSQIRYIKYITQDQEPVNCHAIDELNSSDEINDFYEMYYNWCREQQNKYNDFVSFQQYLLRIIQEIISGIECIEIPNYSVGKDAESFNKKIESLKQFKMQRRPQKKVSPESLQVDINNILYTLSLRKTSNNQSIWQINEFIVSADQLLTNWSKEVFPGIPIVVIPSVWLSIILRFSGRTNDDYKSYCLFLGLRQHRAEDDIVINPVWLLTILAKKTINKDIKEKIIFEIISNKDQYSFETKEDYETSADKAFDKVLYELKSENTQNIETLKAEMKSEIWQIKADTQEKELRDKLSQEEVLIKISSKRALHKVIWFSEHSFIPNILFLIGVILCLCIGISFMYQINPLYNILILILPSSINDNMTLQWNFIVWFLGFLIGAIPVSFSRLFVYLGSEKRKKAFYKKYYAEGKRAMEVEVDNKPMPN